MNVTFTCPDCQRDVRVEVAPIDQALRCPNCHAALCIPQDAFDGPALTRCLVCPSRDLFVRKDFPQRLGVAIVVVGFVASSVAWYYYSVLTTFAILFLTALVDVLLYAIVGDSLTCYRCGAQYRMAEGMERHKSFNLETHERYRQQKARLGG
jgi:hypothetical protein